MIGAAALQGTPPGAEILLTAVAVFFGIALAGLAWATGRAAWQHWAAREQKQTRLKGRRRRSRR